MAKRSGSNDMSEYRSKRMTSKKARQTAADTIEDWCKEQGATESVTFDEETGEPLRTFTIKL